MEDGSSSDATFIEPKSNFCQLVLFHGETFVCRLPYLCGCNIMRKVFQIHFFAAQEMYICRKKMVNGMF